MSYGWLRSTVAGTLVFGRRTDHVLRSACSQRVTTMWVNRPLQVSQLGQLSLSSFRGRQMSSRAIISDFYRASVAPSGECLRGKGRPYRIVGSTALGTVSFWQPLWAKPWTSVVLIQRSMAKPGCCCPAWQTVYVV